MHGLLAWGIPLNDPRSILMRCFQITLVPIPHTEFYFLGGKLNNNWTFLNCHHVTARHQVADGGTASNMVGSCEYIE